MPNDGPIWFRRCPVCRRVETVETGEVVAEGVAVLHQHRPCTQQYVPDAPLRWIRYSPWNPSTSVTGREASMIPLRIVFAITAILLTRDAFAQRGMWIGTAPFCSGSPADCTDLGMTYVKSDSTGDGGKCWTGTKVYCSGYPAPEIAFSGYDDCDGFQCHRTMCGLNRSPGPRVIASKSWYFCPICGSANYRTIMRLNKVPNAQMGRACPWPYP